MTEREQLMQEELLQVDRAPDWASYARQRLAERGKSQEWLARELGVSLGTMNRWMRGIGEPKFGQALAVCAIFADWPKLAYLSLHRWGDVLRPRWSPRLVLVPAA